MTLPMIDQLPSPNYSSRGSATTRLIVVHDCEGSYAGSVGWFAMARFQVSAHLVLSEDGSRATQMVAFANKAWHVCNFNPFSEGIEAAGYAAKGLGAPEWQALAELAAWRAKANGIPWQRATAANNWTGVCQHVDLGAAGGGHHDITSDPAIWDAFFAMGAAAYGSPASPIRSTSIIAIPAPPAGWSPSSVPRHDLVPPSMEWVQMRLNAIMSTQLIVDGLEGGMTRLVLKQFQQKRGLVADGIVGPQTVAALSA